jgi:hypothetical protein
VAQRIHHFSILADAGTTASAPNVRVLTFPAGDVVALELHVPAGHRGKTGFQLAYGNTQVIPRAGGAYFHGNKVHHRWEYEDPYPGGTGWYSQTYNTGRYDHYFRLQVEVDEIVNIEQLLPPVLLLRQAF